MVLSNFVKNKKQGGEKTHRLTVAELAAHSHPIKVAEGTSGAYANKVKAGRRDDSFVNTSNTEPVGNNQPHNNLQPYIAVHYWHRVA